MSSIRKRVVFDLMLTIALVFEMLYQLTGNTLHELVGALFFACIVAHILFARRWISKSAKALKDGEIAQRQKRLVIVAALLAIDVTLLAISSFVISQTLWDAGVDLTFLNPGNVWYPIHTATAYALCILVLAHLAMHWKSVSDVLRVEYDPSRREAISSAVNGLAIIGGIALGIGGVMRTGLQASDLVVTPDEENDEPVVMSGYRERDAQTGEYITVDSLGVTSISSEEGSTEIAKADSSGAKPTICPICPRQCKLSAPRCERPYEAGLIT